MTVPRKLREEEEEGDGEEAGGGGTGGKQMEGQRNPGDVLSIKRFQASSCLVESWYLIKQLFKYY